MNTVTVSLPLQDWINEIVPKVFDTMLTLKASPSSSDLVLPAQERVSGSIGFAGDPVNGALYLHLPVAMAREATTRMLGLGTEEFPDDSAVNDVVGELCNMVAGGLKSSLCDVGVTCAVSTPAVIRGAVYEIEAMSGLYHEQFPFDCLDHRVAVEVHLKFN